MLAGGCPCRDPSPQELVIELGWGVSWRWGSWVDSGVGRW